MNTPPRTLDGSVALVTGGRGRLGSEIVRQLEADGAAVGSFDISPTTQFGGVESDRVALLDGDVMSETEFADAVDACEERFGGPVTTLVNAHGVYPNQATLETPLQEVRRVFDINVFGTLLTSKHLAARWRDRGLMGSIVNFGSGAAFSPRPGGVHYAASKAAVHGLTRALALEFADFARVNAVAPGLVLDEVYSNGSAAMQPYVEFTVSNTPLGRTGSPEDIAEAVLFLASNRSGWITGVVLRVDGGESIGRLLAPSSESLSEWKAETTR